MKVPHHLIAKFPQVGWLLAVVDFFNIYLLGVFLCILFFVIPQVLNTKYLRVRERHMFLEYLGKAQYDPSLPNYIALDRLVTLPDETFCTEVASATLEDFYLFQKTL